VKLPMAIAASAAMNFPSQKHSVFPALRRSQLIFGDFFGHNSQRAAIGSPFTKNQYLAAFKKIQNRR